MGAPSLQDGIDKAGSPMKLLWQQNPEPWNPENIEPEYAGWRAEQHAWHDGVSLSDLSHHMFDTFIEGPDATRLLQRDLREQLRELRGRPGQAVRPGDQRRQHRHRRHPGADRRAVATC